MSSRSPRVLLCALGAAFVMISCLLMAQDKVERGPIQAPDLQAPAQHDPTEGKRVSMKEFADVIFLNGNIYPGENPVASHPSSPQPKQGRAEALAVRDGRVLAIGATDQIKKLKGPHTQVTDLGGNFVMPGFNDAHVHLAAGGFLKLNVNLTGVKSLAEMKQRIAPWTTVAAPGEWILGRGWDESNWPEHRLPSRQDLDSITAGHPALMIRVDGHVGVANTAALATTGFGKGTPDPPGGKLDRDANGELTGIVRENALEIVKNKIPEPSPAQRRQAIELALEDAAQWGITSLQDSPDAGGAAAASGDWQNFLVLEDLELEGKLNLRVSKWLIFSEDLPMLQKHRERHEQSDPMLHIGMLKGFLDGSLGSHTAALLAPYSDQANNRGVLLYTQDKLNDMVGERVAARFQIGLHAIGDQAMRQALDAFDEAERYAREHAVEPLTPTMPNPQKSGTSNPAEGFRFRVEHVQVIAPVDIPRLHQLGVVASVQPCHLLSDMPWIEQRIGPERSKHAYPWKELLDSGAHLAFGSDFPVESCNPLRSLYAAVTRKNEAGTEEFHPEQKITIAQAIAAFTTGSAYAEFAEREKGTLEPGMLADFVVLDRDLLQIPPDEILHTRVLRTVVGGKTVYEAK